MRQKLALMGYMVLVELVAWFLVVLPVYSFQVSSSSTGYVRTLNAAGSSAMFSAARPAQLSAVASAASAAGASALAMRFVAGAGWVGLGVAVGLVLYEMYYTPTELAAVKAGATPPGTFSVPGYTSTTLPISSGGTCASAPDVCFAPYDQWFMRPSSRTDIPPGSLGCNDNGSAPLVPAGWFGWNSRTGFSGCLARHPASSPSTAGSTLPGPVPTAAEINAWLSTLPANDPLSVQSNTTAVGVGTATQPAGTVLNQPVDATTVTTQVVPAAQVLPTDVVVDPNATKPAGTVTNNTTTQTTTTTTMTTVNPDGSTTKQDTDSAPVSCTSGNHELRTFGGILQDHMDLWKGSGLLSALNLLKTLTWPTAIPTYSLQSNLLGTFTLDFSAWSGMLTAIRSIIIAIAGFVAYRMVFVGAR
jgi:hypothetical protein